MATPSVLSIDIRIPDGTAMKSLESLRWENIPGFVVLTGANGSGKTQLLDFLAHKLMGLPSCSVGNISGAQVLVDGESRFEADAISYIPSRWDFSGSPSMDIAGVQSTRANLWNQLTQHGGHQHDFRLRSLRARLERLLGVSNLGTLSQSDFSNRLPEDLSFLLDERDFTSGLAPVFLAHRLRIAEAREAGLSESDAKAKVGAAPWDLINEAFEASGFQFRVQSPLGTKLLDPLQIRLKSIRSDLEVWPGDLSSGEQVILGMLVWLYRFDNHKGLPKLVLLDEPDAHLHPSMARQLIDVLNGVLVQRHGVRVIMTSHSPSTVALAPEDSIFEMRSYQSTSTAPRISKTSRDGAIGVLTSGIPTLRIHHQNRHQVFVESPYDADNHHALFELVKSLLIQDVSLSFVPSGVAGSQDSGSCDRVKFFVEHLERNGVDTVYGIVDWDGIRVSSPSLLVLGDGERYALENFVFDPLAVAAFLLRERICEPNKLGLPEASTHMAILSLPDDMLQEVVDRILSTIRDELNAAETARSSSREVLTISGARYRLPEWFCELNGHRLEEKLTDAFPGLGKWNKPNALKAALIDRVFRDMPKLVPAALLSTFRAAQSRRPSS